MKQHAIAEIAALVEAIHPDGEWMINIAVARVVILRPLRLIPRLTGPHIFCSRSELREGITAGTAGLTAKWLSAKNWARREIIHDIITGQREGGCAAGALAGVVHSDGEVRACECSLLIWERQGFRYDLRRMWHRSACATPTNSGHTMSVHPGMLCRQVCCNHRTRGEGWLALVGN
jgi:hypothetical protein